MEVGGGHNPHLRADILLDLFADKAPDERPFVQADIHSLPFGDKTFDYVICSHTLEHVANPAKALEELSRVAHKGYIETPSALWEKLFGDDRDHRWLVECKGGELVFTPKDKFFYRHSEILRNSMKEVSRYASNVWGEFYREVSPLWAVQYEWSGSISFKISGEQPTFESNSLEVYPHGLFHEERIISLLFKRLGTLVFQCSKFGRGKRLKRIDISTFLRCSLCKGKLRQNNIGEFCCQNCGAKFPVAQGVIKMLPESAKNARAREDAVGYINGRK